MGGKGVAGEVLTAVLPYDALVIACGARSNTFGINGELSWLLKLTTSTSTAAWLLLMRNIL